MKSISTAIAFVAGLAISTSSMAQENGAAPELDNVKKCVEIQDDDERLACYDQAMVTLGAALDAGNLVVVDKAAVQSAKKEGFGLNLPSLSGLGGIFKSNNDPELPDNVNSVELTIEKTKEFGYKKTRFYFTNGQIWDQIDTSKIRIPKVKDGNPNMALIKKAALGSFSLRVNGEGKKIKVKRVQ